MFGTAGTASLATPSTRLLAWCVALLVLSSNSTPGGSPVSNGLKGPDSLYPPLLRPPQETHSLPGRVHISPEAEEQVGLTGVCGAGDPHERDRLEPLLRAITTNTVCGSSLSSVANPESVHLRFVIAARQIRAAMEGKLVADAPECLGPDPTATAVALSVYADFIIEARGAIEIKSKGLGERPGPFFGSVGEPG